MKRIIFMLMSVLSLSVFAGQIVTVIDADGNALYPPISLTTATEKITPTEGVSYPIVIGAGNGTVTVRATSSTNVFTAGYLIIGYTYE